MKKKYSAEGKPYLFSTDEFMEGLSLAIVSNLHRVETKELLTTEERLWEAAFAYLENCDDDSAIYTHTMLGITNSQNDMIKYWLGEAIKTIMGYIPTKEKKVKLAWGKTYKTPNHILVRETQDDKHIALKVFTDGLIMNKKDFNKLMTDLDTNLDEMTMVQFNRLQYNISTSLGDNGYFNKYKTIKNFKESITTEKEIDSRYSVSKIKYNIDNGFTTDKELEELTSSIFTIIE
jgi:hypothetical protein